MPDATRHDAPEDWAQALSALPLESAPGDGWARLAPRLAPRRSRWRRPAPWLAAAAVLALVALLPWRGPVAPSGEDVDAAVAIDAAAGDPLADLHAESRELESLLRYARDERVSSATAAILAGELDDRIAGIDAALRQPGLAQDEQLALWRERVEVLRSAVGLEGTRRWFAANGTRYDAALVQVD
jgi:hypothetical protein